MTAIRLDEALCFPSPAAPLFPAIAADTVGFPRHSGAAVGGAALFSLRGNECWAADLALKALGSIRRGGALRVASRHLDTAVKNYLFEGVEEECAHACEPWSNLRRRALNAWCIYNEEELAAALRQAGFVDIRLFMAGMGSQNAFCSLDTGEAGLLVREVRRSKEPWR